MTLDWVFRVRILIESFTTLQTSNGCSRDRSLMNPRKLLRQRKKEENSITKLINPETRAIQNGTYTEVSMQGSVKREWLVVCVCNFKFGGKAVRANNDLKATQNQKPKNC